MPKIDRIGETNINKYGSRMTIIQYNNSEDILIQFDDGYITHGQYVGFKKGNVSNPYDKSLFGVGYMGEGIYKSRDEEKLLTLTYKSWADMMMRCYDTNYQENNITYKNCEVCEEWHCFQNYAKWFDENYYKIDNEIMCLDKDILHKGNKIYSPENCVFVPKIINSIFVKAQNKRGKCCIGVTYRERNNSYEANCSYYDFDRKKCKRQYLGQHKTEIKAFQAYKKFKENYIKQVADDYKDKIPQKLYDAMYRYEVEITD